MGLNEITITLLWLLLQYLFRLISSYIIATIFITVSSSIYFENDSFIINLLIKLFYFFYAMIITIIPFIDIIIIILMI